MLKRVRQALTYSNVVASLSLFIVLGGGAYAAKTHLIDGKLLKPGSVTGAKLKRDTLTGKQIKESALGQVPDAAKLGGRPASAYQPAGNYQPAGSYLAANGTAADAAKLGGKDPSAYLPASRIVQGSGDTSAVPADTVLTYAPLHLAVETDGDSDTNSDVVLHDTGSIPLEVSLSTSNTVFVIGAGASSTFTLPGTTRVGDFIVREGAGGNPDNAISLTCGFDFAPNVVNCAGIGIG